MLRKALPIWNINSFAQCFVELLGDYREEFDKSCAKVVRTTRRLYTELAKLECLRPYATEANFVLCELMNNAGASELAQFLFQNFGMLVYDCSTKIGLDSRFARLSSRTDRENDQLITAIKAWERRKP